MTWVEVVQPTQPPQVGGEQVVTRYGQATYGQAVYGGQIPATTWSETE